ncbi:MAG: DUF5722 domain-containing protein [Eubacteriales bacterium]
MKKSRYLLVFLSVILMIACLTVLSSCDEEDSVTKISSAEIKDGNVTVKATLDESYSEKHSGEKLYLLALSSMDGEKSLDSAEVVAESKVNRKMTFKFPLSGENGASRVASAFVLAEKTSDGYSAITSFAYISNPEAVADGAKNANATSGIKGYLSEDIYGSRLLGAEHILIEAEMNKLILEDFKKDAIRFNLDGVSYYYDKNEVEKLDKLIDDANSAKMRIYFRTVLRESENDALSFLYFDRAKSADGYLPNLSDERAVRYVKAFYAFLASRYPVSDFIIGERVNDFGNFCNADKLTSEEFEMMYSFWARISHQMLRSVNSSATVYIPVDNSWRIDASAAKVGVKVFLSRFADKARDEGDYGYAVSLSLGDGDDLDALLSGKGQDYSKIGVTNLSDITKFLEGTDMRYKSDRRNIIIDSLSLSTDIDEKDRASYYTYAYYAACESGFDAFFYSSSVYTEENKRSDLYYAMLMCGSSLNSQLSDYTDSIPEVRIPDFDSYISNNLTYAQSASLNISDKLQKDNKPLSVSPDKLYAGGDVYNIQGKLNDNGKECYLSWIIGADASRRTGAVSAIDISAEDIIKSGYIGLTMSADKQCSVSLMLSAGDNTYIGETTVSHGEKTYFFDISAFAKNVKASEKISLSVCILPCGDDDVSLEIRNMSLYGSSGVGAQTVIVIVVVAVIILALLALIVLLVVKRKKKAARRSSDQ